MIQVCIPLYTFWRICEIGEFPSQWRFFIFKESVDHIVLYPAVSMLKLRFCKVFARRNI